MKTRMPKEMRRFPFAVVAFRTVRHGVVLLSCRYNAALYGNPSEQIREEHAETFEDPEFVVTDERIIPVRES